MFRKIWIQLRSSLWFVPSLLVLVAIVAAFALIEVDIHYDQHLSAKVLRPFLAASAEGARAMLAAIASSMITVAGVAFSITIVTLSLASTQYTPRILRNFMSDRGNQAVLGAFLAIFTYCLIILRSIRSPAEGSPFVPVLAVFVGVLLALLSIGCLIFFIHHVAASIQASYILKVISAETTKTFATMFPEPLVAAQSETPPALPQEIAWQSITSPTSGYVQVIDGGALIGIARDENLLVRIERAPGDFVPEGSPLASVNRRLDEGMANRLRRVWAIGDFRTIEQDPGFGMRQIVDIALKALSPGVNDTSTAVTSLDYLSAILCQLATRKVVPFLATEEGNDRVVAPAVTFADFVNKTFDEIRLSASGNVTIILQMICAVQRVAAVTFAQERQAVLLDQLRRIAEVADHSVAASYDRQRINGELANARAVLAIEIDQLPAISVQRAASPC